MSYYILSLASLVIETALSLCGAPPLDMRRVHNTRNHCRLAPLRSPERRADQSSQTAHKRQPPPHPLYPSSPPSPPTLPGEQPAASGQQPPNCWGEGVLPYLIALNDVIDLPQVVAATCSVADLQQHRAYFLLSQFSRSRCALPSSLKSTERVAENGEGGGGYSVAERERRGMSGRLLHPPPKFFCFKDPVSHI